jgi:hypothetical protein
MVVWVAAIASYNIILIFIIIVDYDSPIYSYIFRQLPATVVPTTNKNEK